MLKYEKKAFWKFFSTYFGSVALLILASGFFYFEEQKKSLIEREHFSMIEYVRELKMKQKLKNSLYITHKIEDIEIKNFNMNNFEIQENYFVKYMPFSWSGGYILVKKEKEGFYKKLYKIKIYIIVVQVTLLAFFAYLSYLLSIQALRPMQEAIKKLDNFSKDLIHDINTPITSILLNMKLLDKDSNYEKSKPLKRIKQSISDISDLHGNLTLLLQEESLITQKENIQNIVDEVVSIQKRIYSDIKFEIKMQEFEAYIDKKAFKQIMQNIVSNACKYNKKDGFVKIYSQGRVLTVEDSGVGIKNPKEVFSRLYKEHSSGSGIGLDIVKRLSDAMKIEIDVVSTSSGTKFMLLFKNYR